ncbi:MAG: hypothetical protein ABIV63_16105, partial [Caldimonas sp.]
DPVRGWRAACHSLRGACATLGASFLPESLVPFEQALRAPADVARLSLHAKHLDADLLSLVKRLTDELDP